MKQKLKAYLKRHKPYIIAWGFSMSICVVCVVGICVTVWGR